MDAVTYRWASSSDVGRARDHNEDAVWPEGTGSAAGELVAAVADGMGGHVGGEVASGVALQAAVTAAGADAVERVRIGNLAVIDRIIAQPRLAGMGTTLTLAVFGADGMLDIGHIGDSRAYVAHAGDLILLTRDHSLVAEMVESGELHPEEASVHPFRSVITRALGMERDVRVDSVDRELSDGDRVLLCTDGLTNMVADAEISGFLTDPDTPAEAATALIDAANGAGGIDNITVVVVDVFES